MRCLHPALLNTILNYVTCSKRLATAAVAAILLSATPAGALIIQVASPVEMTQGPYLLEDFEDDTFVSGITFSPGVDRIAGDGFNRLPSLFGLKPIGFQPATPITVSFDNPATSVGLWFANDDDSVLPLFTAVLDIFDSGGLIGSISVVANMNDTPDQFLGFISDEEVTMVTLRYDDNGNQVGLVVGMDDLQFNVVPEPSTALLLGTGLAGVALRRRRIQAGGQRRLLGAPRCGRGCRLNR